MAVTPALTALTPALSALTPALSHRMGEGEEGRCETVIWAFCTAFRLASAAFGLALSALGLTALTLALTALTPALSHRMGEGGGGGVSLPFGLTLCSLLLFSRIWRIRGRGRGFIF